MTLIDIDKPSSHCLKGAIHWYSIKKPNLNVNSIKKRPFIIIGRNNNKSKRVLVSPIQDLSNYIEDGKVKYPYHVPLLKNKYGFLQKDSVILLDQVYTIAKEDLKEVDYVGSINDFKELDNAIIYNFDLYESIVEGIGELMSQYKDIYKNNFSRV